MTIHDQRSLTAQGEPFNFGALRGQVLLIVNVASRCGFTPQLRELERLYRRYRQRGFMVIGFPCNQFGRQSPESAQEFCALSARDYQVSFPLMEKVKVNGGDADPLFVELKRQAPGVLGTGMIKWNFTKFLVGRDGRVIRRFSPRDGEAELRIAIELALDEA
ncbi:glutathione peroxidase [Halomonas sp. KAO]|uniref:glutathione peroxidase n=1 Tax=unclassified Halomonas TaxID=2609666 RepID=UPI00189E99B2|nr:MULTISPECIES: glutathione peroxidase [unclassified Halomonas]MBF7054934.1 glutathione peroxidase [Halomonas sp. KAO]MDT0501469.1 glutathione peroxidase [Halomonas sp. PAR7]MDT0512849.1 glutathione peroxidase [Halomonas sp. LES1]MDT0591326.1 glutathione peroxidase [Halomonas sp. PAR8]